MLGYVGMIVAQTLAHTCFNALQDMNRNTDIDMGWKEPSWIFLIYFVSISSLLFNGRKLTSLVSNHSPIPSRGSRGARLPSKVHCQHAWHEVGETAKMMNMMNIHRPSQKSRQVVIPWIKLKKEHEIKIDKESNTGVTMRYLPCVSFSCCNISSR